MANKLRCIIAGSRNIENYEFVSKIIDSCPFRSEIIEVVSGTAKGVDELGERWAKKNGILIKQFPADWDKFGKGAGYRRNEEMAKYADAAIIIHKDGSKGTQHMKDLAEKYNLKVHYVEVKDKDVFSLAQLKELRQSLEGKQFVGGELSRKLLDQQIQQLQEYVQIVRDTKIIWKALAAAEYYIDYDYVDKSEIDQAFNTPTAKFIESLRANNKQNS